MLWKSSKKLSDCLLNFTKMREIVIHPKKKKSLVFAVEKKIAPVFKGKGFGTGLVSGQEFCHS